MWIAIFLLAHFTEARSQNRFNRDSLLSVVNNPTSTDSMRLAALNDMVQNHFYQNQDSLIHYAQILLELSKNLKDQRNIGRAHNYLGKGYKTRGDYNQALDHHLQSLEHALVLGDSSQISKTYMYCAIVFKDVGEYERSLSYYGIAEKYLPSASSIRDRSQFSVNRALVYGSMGNREKCQEILVGILSRIRGDSTEPKTSLAPLLFNIGHTYKASGNTEKALFYFEQSLADAKEHNNVQIQAVINYGIGEVLLKEGKQELALRKFYEVIERPNIQSNKKLLGHVHYSIAKALSNSQPMASIDHLGTAIDLAGITSNIKLEIDAVELMSEVIHRTGKVDKAFTLLKRATFLKDSLTLLELNKKALAQEFRNEMEQKEEEFRARLKAQSTQSSFQFNQYLTIYSGLILVGLITAIIVIWRLRNDHQNALHQTKIRKQTQLKLTSSEDIDIKNFAILEKPILGKINDTDKQILECIHQNPLISNQEIANQVNRSLEGVSSSLRKMYRQYNVPPSKNRKLALVETIISLQEEQLATQN